MHWLICFFIFSIDLISMNSTNYKPLVVTLTETMFQVDSEAA